MKDVFYDVASCKSCENRHSSETSVLSRSAPGHIPEDGILHSHRRENLNSYMVWQFTSCFVLRGIYLHFVYGENRLWGVSLSSILQSPGSYDLCHRFIISSEQRPDNRLCEPNDGVLSTDFLWENITLIWYCPFRMFKLFQIFSGFVSFVLYWEFCITKPRSLR
jgi:hypothetical protein